MTGKEYRDLVAGYIDKNFGPAGLAVYIEVSLGKTIIGKDRRVDVFVVRGNDQRSLAIECKYQDVQGTVDEKIPYALQDLEAMRVPGCLAYAGGGWSPGILHTLAASPLAAYCLPDAATAARTPETRELDHVLSATFGLWDMILPITRRFTPR
ncbi:MAG TPA: PD-(D/E)XK nuclease superfamily protein [Kofleriaceae bacterium]|nr:PD-(D/E)XK nuclease superfamily protein [Kofleriaceae bacterium]